MRYKITWTKGPKTNRWGYYTPDQPPVYEEFAETLEEATARALEISSKYKKYDVNVCDIQGPSLPEYGEDAEPKTWCVDSYKNGHLVCPRNPLYVERVLMKK